MAVDSRVKRLSMLVFSTDAPMIDPSGSVDDGDRLTFMGLYRGIAAGAPVVVAEVGGVIMIWFWMVKNRA